jgi:hypothetical protein
VVEGQQFPLNLVETLSDQASKWKKKSIYQLMHSMQSQFWFIVFSLSGSLDSSGEQQSYGLVDLVCLRFVAFVVHLTVYSSFSSAVKIYSFSRLCCLSSLCFPHIPHVPPGAPFCHAPAFLPLAADSLMRRLTGLIMHQ